MKKLIFILSLGFIFGSCSDYLDVNTDPNNPTEVDAALVLPVAQTYSANQLLFDRYMNTFGNMMMANWSQSDGYSWYDDEFLYLVSTTFYDQIWNYSYRNTLKQYNILDVESENMSYYSAISKIMKSYQFQYLVDAYGDIPYFEALQRGSNLTPAFDDAQVVYDDLIVELDNAILLIENASMLTDVELPGEDDIIFHGDMNKWLQLANTIKMRVLIRQSGLSSKQDYIQNEFTKIENSGYGFITEDVMVQPGYIQDVGKQNPFWDDYGADASGVQTNNGKATCASDYIIGVLESNNDPRIDYIYQLPASGTHLGVPQGLAEYPSDDSFVPTNVSLIGPGLLKTPEQGSVIFLMSESYFLQAEAAQRGYLTGDAQTFYENGIAASFDYLGASGASSYASQNINLVGWNASSNKIEAIITQKSFALNGINGFEAWIEYNRTGYPQGIPVSLQATTSDRPVRLFYPASELSANPTNVPAQPDAFADKIFWAN
jgi:hypothetical protein